MSENKKKINNMDFVMDIDPKILKILGPQMYTNIYFIFGELIANAYDADANNVFVEIDSKNSRIIIEDDGIGMDANDINSKYLKVALESRESEKDSLTALKRVKMGRKGLGKLSALAISDSVRVTTLKNGYKNGFIFSADLPQDKVLTKINQDEIEFKNEVIIKGHGTKIELNDVKISTPKLVKTFKKNINKILPIFSEEFKLNIKIGDEVDSLSSLDSTLFGEVATVRFIGDTDIDLSKLKANEKFVKKIDEIKTKINIKNKLGKIVEKELIIKGWIATLKSTKGSKKNMDDFPENYISVYSNKKMGLFNLIPIIGKNKLIETFIIGMIEVDLFEDSDLDDMAIPNREGYVTSDIRWIKFKELIRPELDKVIADRVDFNNDKNKLKKIQDINKLKIKEEKLKKQKEKFWKQMNNKKFDSKSKESVNKVLENMFNLKEELNDKKKKILISHASKDKDLADVVYNFLEKNNVPKSEIIYSSSDFDESKLPTGTNVFEYLRSFFVKSVSNSNLCVIFILTGNMEKSWNTIIEAGGGWVTKTDSRIIIFNKYDENNNFVPSHLEGKEIKQPHKPLNDEDLWINIKLNDENNWVISESDINELCRQLEDVIKKIGIEHRDRSLNIEWFKELDEIV